MRRHIVTTAALAPGSEGASGEALKGRSGGRVRRVRNAPSGLEQGREEARKPVRGQGAIQERAERVGQRARMGVDGGPGGLHPYGGWRKVKLALQKFGGGGPSNLSTDPEPGKWGTWEW